MRKIAYLICLTIIFAFVSKIPAFAEEAEYSQNINPIYSFKIRIDGEVYSFPMTYKEFTSHGWELVDKIEQPDTITPNQTSLINFKKDKSRILTFINNFDVNTKPVEDCYVCGISFERHDMKKIKVELPCNIEFKKADADDIIDVYGEPTELISDDFMTALIYEEDINSYVQLGIYDEEETLSSVTIRNINPPKDFEFGNVVSKISDEVDKYSPPEKLSNDPNDFVIKVGDDFYQLPIPINAFEDNGWIIQEANSAQAIPAKTSDWVTLWKDDKSFASLAANNSDNATIPSNCWVSQISSMDSEDNMPIKTFCGIKTGMGEDELIEVLEDYNIPYSKKRYEDMAVYKVGDKSNYYEFIVSKLEGNLFEKDTICQIIIKKESPIE